MKESTPELEAVSHEDVSPTHELIRAVTQKKNGEPLPLQSVFDRFNELDKAEQEQLIDNPDFIHLVIRSTIMDRKTENQAASTMTITERLGWAPDSLKRAIAFSEDFYEAATQSVLRTGHSIISIQKILDHIEMLPEQIQDSVTRDPRVVEAMILYIIEPNKPSKSRLESVPSALRDEILSDQRIQQRIK